MRPISLAVLTLVLLGCPGDSTKPEEECPGFCGTWSGGESSGAQNTGSIEFTVTGNNIAGEVAPISGSQREFTGNIEDGAILAVIPAAPGGCAVTLNGTIGFANNGTGAGSATGTYVLQQSSTCNTNNGTWSAIKAAQ
jgi:hypothetical protein